MTGHHVLACYRTCWACRFEDHPGNAHGWADVDDLDAAEAKGRSPEYIEELMSQPCACTCNPDVTG